MKGLIGRTEIEDALKRLDKLTQEEARMAAAQNLRVTHTVDDRVKGVTDAVVAVDNRVAGVDDRVQLTQEEARMTAAQNLDATHTVDDRVKGVADAVVAVDNRVASVDGRVKLTQEEAQMAAAQNLKATHTVDDRVKGVSDAVIAVDNRVAGVDDRVQQMADEVKRLSFPNLTSATEPYPFSGNQLRESIHKWLSPPDPSTNYNIACDTHHKKTATWFFQGSIFQEWKSTGSFVWIHGKRLSCLISLTPSDPILYYSWLRQERYLVRGSLMVHARSD